MRANARVGRLLGILVFTPFDDWRQGDQSYENADG